MRARNVRDRTSILVEGTERLAPSTGRADWNERPSLTELTARGPVISAQLAESWTRIALMEHASIAAFARFTLQLMSLGAPAALVERATAAMADEIKHAKACFAVAGPTRARHSARVAWPSSTAWTIRPWKRSC